MKSSANISDNEKSTGVIIKAILILFIYCLLLNLPYIHLREFMGEAGTRVTIAKNMMETGEWIVPYCEGRPYLNKPPLYNWLLALGFCITGKISELTARIPSVVAAFLSALSLSFFWKSIAGVRSIWFILPGLVFLTFSDVLDKSIRAEIDIFFTFFVTVSILTWFYFYEVLKKEFAAWIISLAILGISVLTKGIQAPAFFYCGIIPYLIYKKETKKIFSLSHLFGIAIALAIFSIWVIPFVSVIGVSEVASKWFKEIAVRSEPLLPGGFWRHFIQFPFDYFVAYLPWLPFLYLWNYKPSQKEPMIIRNLAAYCLCFLLISFPIYWILPGARLRYLLPLSGTLALLITIPLYALIDQKIQTPGLAEKYITLLGLCFLIAAGASPFWGNRFDLFDHTIPVILLCLVFIASIFLVFWRKIFRNKIILLLVTLLLVKALWASFYFPYHDKNMSVHRKAARQINLIVSLDENIYFYRLYNPHLSYYLNRNIRRIEFINEACLEEKVFLLTRDESLDELAGAQLYLVEKIKMRGYNLLLYKVMKCL